MINEALLDNAYELLGMKNPSDYTTAEEAFARAAGMNLNIEGGDK